MAKPQSKVLVLLPVISLVFGCLEYGPDRGPEAGSLPLTLHAMLSLAVIFTWFLMDARQRAYRSSLFLKASMLGVTVAALPYYLFRSRGMGGGLKALSLSVLVFAGTMAAYRLGSLFA